MAVLCSSLFEKTSTVLLTSSLGVLAKIVALRSKTRNRDMIRYKWQIVLGISLIAVSMALFIAQIIIFHDARNTFFYLLQDIAFIPIQVLLVTLILNQLLNVREKVAMLNKLNMVIGAFFSEVGSGLLRRFSEFDHNADRTRAELQVSLQWSEQHFSHVA